MKCVQLLALIAVLLISVAGCSSGGATPQGEAAADEVASEKPAETGEPELSLGDTRTRSLDGAVMVYVPAGVFDMGSDDAEVDYALELCKTYDTNCNRRYFSVESPVHEVAVDGFWLDRTEVTQGRYARCVEAGACGEPECRAEGQAGDAELPVVGVTWNQAAAYCQWAGGRLPTEAEWEWAARGPERPRYPWGDELDGTLLNYCDSNCGLGKRDEAFDDGYARSAPVGSYPGGASWVGALDMAGNVWEAVADWNGPYPSERQANPTGPLSGQRRVARGGSWHTSPDHARSAIRTHIGLDDAHDHLGFRCAMSVP